MGLSWPGVMKALVATGFALWLTSVAAQLALIARIPGVVAILTALGAAAWFSIRTWPTRSRIRMSVGKAKNPERRRAGAHSFGNSLTTSRTATSTSSARAIRTSRNHRAARARPRSQAERRADLAHEKGERDALTRELRDATYAMAKFNDYTAPGGPEGSSDGRSGYGAGTMGPNLPGGYPITNPVANASVSSLAGAAAQRHHQRHRPRLIFWQLQRPL